MGIIIFQSQENYACPLFTLIISSHRCAKNSSSKTATCKFQINKFSDHLRMVASDFSTTMKQKKQHLYIHSNSRITLSMQNKTNKTKQNQGQSKTKLKKRNRT